GRIGRWASRQIVVACERDAFATSLRAARHRAGEPREPRPRSPHAAPDRSADEPRGPPGRAGGGARPAPDRDGRGDDRRGAAPTRAPLLRRCRHKWPPGRPRGRGVSADVRHAAAPRTGDHRGGPRGSLSIARLGKVYGNRMVDLQPRSAKLRERAVRLIAEIAGVRPPLARRALAESGGSVRVAIVMARYGLSRRRAARVLRDAGGSLRGVLQRPRRKELTRTRTGPSLKAKRSQPKGRTIAAAGSQNVPFLQ